MGCAASSIEKEERVQVCKERKRLMKQLVSFRGEFADAQLAYLRALKNTGATLRQFTESENLELETTTYGLVLPPSPPPPLPPSPPPPPPFSPDSRKIDNTRDNKISREESLVICEDDNITLPSSSWDWGSSKHSSVRYEKKSEMVRPIEEENWAETKTEFEEDDEEEENMGHVVDLVNPENSQIVERFNDNSSTMSSPSETTKDTTDRFMVSRKVKRTLEGLVKELDDYFLKASAGIKEIAVLMSISSGNNTLQQNFKENKRKRRSSAKVFNALSWSWSFKSVQYAAADTVKFCGPSKPCSPGAHSITLKKLYAAEQRLHKAVKDEEGTKLEHERKSILLQKQEEENHDWSRTEKTRLSVESLEADLISLEQSISSTSASILMLIDEELYPQLIALTSGLMHVWRTMCECHQVQNHISQRLNHITENHSIDLSTDYHRQATVQLETEVMAWYNSFCKLVESQNDYVRTLCRWIKLTDGLVNDQQRSVYSSVVCGLCERWQLGLERLPDKVTSVAIKNLLSAIHSILQQQIEEHNLQKKYEKLEKRLQKESYLLAEMEIKHEANLASGDGNVNLSPKNPLSLKRSKTEALKQLVDSEKAKYLNSVQLTKTMTLNNLKTGLPSVFQALVGFAHASVQAIEAACSRVTRVDCHDNGEMASTAD